MGVREVQGVQRQLTSSKGPETMGISTMNKGPPFQVRVFLFFFLSLSTVNTHLTVICLCVQNRKELSVQVKNKLCVRIRIMRLVLVHQSTW